MLDDLSEEFILDVLTSLPLFAQHFLKIRTKKGELSPFIFNSAQEYLHKRLEAQLHATGKVRALILKGRQQGCSTYVQGRFFHKATTTLGKKAFILTHEAEASKNLFEMARNFYENMEVGIIPEADKANARELKFATLQSEYAVATAGNKGAGRSQTIQLFHGSEVAYWPNAEDHAKGVLQAVSGEANTEIILESTANGIGNYFYNAWNDAVSGKSDFQAIFIPWYWQTEYTAKLRDGETVTLSEEEEELFKHHNKNGLTVEHLYWRRRKLTEFSSDYETSKELFNVEYPMTALDAFRNPVADRFIKTHLVMNARKNKVQSDSPLVVGIDPAISDKDKLAIIRRRGRRAYGLETYHNMKSMEIVGLVRRIIDSEKPAKVAIDCIGLGDGIVDRLRELGYGEIVEGVNVARSANDKDNFINQRAELWHDMREWLAQEMPVEIPDSDELMGDLTSLGRKNNSSAKLQIESKDDLRARGMKSPDTADALALTFVVGDYLTGGSYQTNFLPDKAAGMFI